MSNTAATTAEENGTDKTASASSSARGGGSSSASSTRNPYSTRSKSRGQTQSKRKRWIEEEEEQEAEEEEEERELSRRKRPSRRSSRTQGGAKNKGGARRSSTRSKQAVARSKKKRREEEEEEEEEEDEVCEICKKDTEAEKMLLCDGCDSGWHMFCLDPPLEAVPEGDWFCPRCCQKKAENAEGKEKQETEQTEEQEEEEDEEQDEVEENNSMEDEEFMPPKEEEEEEEVNGDGTESEEDADDEARIYAKITSRSRSRRSSGSRQENGNSNNSVSEKENQEEAKEHETKTRKKRTNRKDNNSEDGTVMETGRKAGLRQRIQKSMTRKKAEAARRKLAAEFRQKLRKQTETATPNNQVSTGTKKEERRTSLRTRRSARLNSYAEEEEEEEEEEETEENGEENEDDEEDDTKCECCGREDDPENMLLCDGENCNKAYHTYCIFPPLDEIPEGDWFCDQCDMQLNKRVPTLVSPFIHASDHNHSTASSLNASSAASFDPFSVDVVQKDGLKNEDTGGWDWMASTASREDAKPLTTASSTNNGLPVVDFYHAPTNDLNANALALDFALRSTTQTATSPTNSKLTPTTSTSSSSSKVDVLGSILGETGSTLTLNNNSNNGNATTITDSFYAPPITTKTSVSKQQTKTVILWRGTISFEGKPVGEITVSFRGNPSDESRCQKYARDWPQGMLTGEKAASLPFNSPHAANPLIPLQVLPGRERRSFEYFSALLWDNRSIWCFGSPTSNLYIYAAYLDSDQEPSSHDKKKLSCVLQPKPKVKPTSSAMAALLPQQQQQVGSLSTKEQQRFMPGVKYALVGFSPTDPGGIADSNLATNIISFLAKTSGAIYKHENELVSADINLIIVNSKVLHKLICEIPGILECRLNPWVLFIRDMTYLENCCKTKQFLPPPPQNVLFPSGGLIVVPIETILNRDNLIADLVRILEEEGKEGREWVVKISSEDIQQLKFKVTSERASAAVQHITKYSSPTSTIPKAMVQTIAPEEESHSHNIEVPSIIRSALKMSFIHIAKYRHIILLSDSKPMQTIAKAQKLLCMTLEGLQTFFADQQRQRRTPHQLPFSISLPTPSSSSSSSPAVPSSSSPSASSSSSLSSSSSSSSSSTTSSFDAHNHTSNGAQSNGHSSFSSSASTPSSFSPTLFVPQPNLFGSSPQEEDPYTFDPFS